MGTSGFNLQQSIDAYISLIKNQGSITGSDAAELTAHLFDATDSLKSRGLSEEEAFLIARKRLGEEAVLTEEYSKVNTSVKTNKIWAYMFIGLNIFFSVPSLALSLLAASNLYVYKVFGDSIFGASIITACHVLFCVLIWSVVINKRRISYFIETQVEVNPIRISCLSFIPLFIIIAGRVYHAIDLSYVLRRYPIDKFSSSIPEFSFYLVLMSVVTGGLCLLFSINKVERLTLRRSLFERPSTIFLVLLGICVELFAASTRAIRIESILGSAIIFGAVYMVFSFLIAFYNRKNEVNRYLLIATVLGLILEAAVGVVADLDRGNTYFTAYFVSVSIISIVIGRYLGMRLSEGNNFLWS